MDNKVQERLRANTKAADRRNRERRLRDEARSVGFRLLKFSGEAAGAEKYQLVDVVTGEHLFGGAQSTSGVVLDSVERFLADRYVFVIRDREDYWATYPEVVPGAFGEAEVFVEFWDPLPLAGKQCYKGWQITVSNDGSPIETEELGSLADEDEMVIKAWHEFRKSKSLRNLKHFS